MAKTSPVIATLNQGSVNCSPQACFAPAASAASPIKTTMIPTLYQTSTWKSRAALARLLQEGQHLEADDRQDAGIRLRINPPRKASPSCVARRFQSMAAAAGAVGTAEGATTAGRKCAQTDSLPACGSPAPRTSARRPRGNRDLFRVARQFDRRRPDDLSVVRLDEEVVEERLVVFLRRVEGLELSHSLYCGEGVSLISVRIGPPFFCVIEKMCHPRAIFAVTYSVPLPSAKAVNAAVILTELASSPESAAASKGRRPLFRGSGGGCDHAAEKEVKEQGGKANSRPIANTHAPRRASFHGENKDDPLYHSAARQKSATFTGAGPFFGDRAISQLRPTWTPSPRGTLPNFCRFLPASGF